MVTYAATDIIPMRSFVYQWRITDAQWNALSNELLAHIVPLTPERSEQIGHQGRAFRQEQLPPKSTTYYQIVSQCSLAPINSADNENIQRWFQKLPINHKETVYVNWGDNVAIVTEWYTFTNVWFSLWYPFDAVEVFDDTLSWAALFGPEEIATFIMKRSLR